MIVIIFHIMKKDFITVWKPPGKTPLETVNMIKNQFPDYKNSKLSYAGRLDPMAEGVLLILVDEENKKRNKYENLEKTYEFEALLGVETDTYDCMGIIKNIKPSANIDHEEFKNILENYEGVFDQKYPPYSSARVLGKPLFYWARKNMIDKISIPSKQVEIYSLKFIDQKKMILKQIAPKIINRIQSVNGKFRQKQIIEKWNDFLIKNPNMSFSILKIEASVSSGVYIRSICHKLGQETCFGAVAFSIKRTKVGNIDASSCINLQSS